MDWKEKSRNILLKHMPEAALEPIIALQEQYGFSLVITNPRSTKFGDYRAPQRGSNYHRISVNGDLNPFQFLVTLLHEIAHLITWERHKNRVLPHGKEWKMAFSELATPYLLPEIFPNDILLAFSTYLKSPTASSCSDDGLHQVMLKYNAKTIRTVQMVAYGELFGMPPRIFRKGQLMRKRYKCLEVVSNRWYMVHPQAEAHLLPEDVYEKVKHLGHF
jgi:SprT protein